MNANSNIQFSEIINRLKSILFRFDEIVSEEKINLLHQLNSSLPAKIKDWKQAHQILITMMAYPDNKIVLELVQTTLSNLLNQLEKKQTLISSLNGTGFLHTAIECNFSYSKVNYLINAFPSQVSIHSTSSSIETQKSVLKLILPNVEYSKIHLGEKDFKTRIKEFSGSSKLTDLEWLVQIIQQSSLDKKTKAFVYQQLGIFIQWKISDKKDSVSFLRGASLPMYFHTKPLDKKNNLQEIIQQALPLPVNLNLKERQQLIHAAKMTLTYLYRETEPFTNANENDITLFDLGKGISIALFGSTVDKRYSLESYIGYLVLKNNISASYGGGWILGERCQFGINILEAFRGGESGLIICELLRVYHQYFGATRFVVKPYQFGLHNTEALKTGAFWFYYKLGFRPEDSDLKGIAYKEEQAKQLNPSYKSDLSTLKKYTKSNLALTLSSTSYPEYDSEFLSQKITTFINTHFEGNRTTAMNQCFKVLKEGLDISLKDWEAEDIQYAKEVSLLFCLNLDAKNWIKKHQKNLKLFIQLKSVETELPWIKHLQRFDAFWKMINSCQ
jgi:hypothetical protein